jgi:hypothetical protein
MRYLQHLVHLLNLHLYQMLYLTVLAVRRSQRMIVHGHRSLQAVAVSKASISHGTKNQRMVDFIHKRLVQMRKKLVGIAVTIILYTWHHSHCPCMSLR